MASGALLFGIAILESIAPARADCMRDLDGRVVCDAGQCVRDSHGMVHCSRFEDGAAVRDRYGEVLCGRGACVTTIRGEIICSTVPGGAALKDSRGRATCEGGCESASAELCGQTTGSSP